MEYKPQYSDINSFYQQDVSMENQQIIMIDHSELFQSVLGELVDLQTMISVDGLSLVTETNNNSIG